MKSLIHMLSVVAIAAMVGCAPTEAPEFVEPPDIGFENGSFAAELNGFAIHYEVHGQGPVLMVLPQSWGLSIEGLRQLYTPLEEKLSLVYFDPRGMGASAAISDESDMGMAAVRADFDALRLHLGLEMVNAIGWSNGAMNLILLAAEHPNTLANAIFVHGVASYTEEDNAEIAVKYPELIQEYAQFLEDVQNPDLTDQQRTEMMRALWFERWFPLSTADPENAPLLFERLFGDAQFSWTHADYANRENPTFDARDQLPLITARCLVIAGAYDMLSVERVQELADGLEDAEFVVFESSGHFAPAEEPEVFADAVFTFLGAE